MLPRKHRVTRAEFDTLLRPDFQLHSPTFRVAVIKKENPSLQATVIASKKVAKKAHDRNLITRHVYNILHDNKKMLLLPAMIGFFTKPGIDELSFTELEKELKQVLAEISKKLS